MPSPDAAWPLLPIDEALVRARAGIEALEVVAGAIADGCALDGPATAESRDLDEVVQACRMVEGELAHQIERLSSALVAAPGRGRDPSHLLRLAAGYAETQRHLRILRTHLATRRADGRIAPSLEP